MYITIYISNLQVNSVLGKLRVIGEVGYWAAQPSLALSQSYIQTYTLDICICFFFQTKLFQVLGSFFWINKGFP